MDQLRSRHTLILLVAILLSGLAAGVVWAQAPTPPVLTTPGVSQPASPSVQAPVPDDKVVLKVGDQKFTKADIDRLIQHLDPRSQQAIATQGKKEIGDRYALVVALSDQAQLHHLDQTPEFVQRMALEKQQMEAQLAFEEINQQAKVTPDEVHQYFTAHSSEYEQIMVRQFVVRKKAAESTTLSSGPKPDPAHPAASTGQGLSPEEAKTRAEAIRKEVAAGTDIKKVIEDFKAPGDVIIEAEPRAIRRGGMRPEMEKVAFALKDGEISEPMDLPQALVFFQVTKHTQADVKDVTPEIEKKLEQQKVNATLDGIKKSANVWMDEQYFGAPSKPAAGPTLGGPVGKITPKP